MLLVWKILEKSEAWAKRPFVWKSHLKWFVWACKVYEVRSQGITRVNRGSQVDGDSDLVSTCWLCGRRAQKRNNGLCQHLYLGESCPSNSHPDNSVSPQMSLLPQSWSWERVSECNKFVHGPFKRNCLGFHKSSISLSHNPCCFAQSIVMETSLPGTGPLGLGVCGGDRSPHSTRGVSAAEIFLPVFYLPPCMWD